MLGIYILLGIVALLICQFLTYKIMWNIYEKDFAMVVTPYPMYLYIIFHIPYVNIFASVILYIFVWDFYNNE